MTPEMWPHQLEAVEFAKKRDGSMFAMEVGTGKTRTAIEWIKAGGIERALVVAPKPGVNVWPREMRKYYPDGPPVIPLTGTAKEQTLTLYNTPGPAIFATSYGISWRDPFKKLLMQKFDQLNLEAGILDESHLIKSAGSTVSKTWGFMQRRFKRRIAMTGTPLADKPIDAYGQMRWVDPEVFGTNFTDFTGQYVRYGGFQNRQILGYVNQDRFMQRLNSATYWAFADEVLSLPEGHDIYRYFDLPPKTRTLYNELRDESVAELSNERYVKAGSALTKLLRLQQFTSGFAVDSEGKAEDLHTLKGEIVEEILESAPNEKVVVFCLFHRDLDLLRSVTERLGRRYGELSGRRDDLVESSYPPDKDVLGVQMKSGSAAVDFTASHLVIFWSTGYSLTDYRQAKGRVLRPGQEHAVRFIHLLASKSVDVKVTSLLAKKHSVIEGLRMSAINQQGIDQEEV